MHRPALPRLLLLLAARRPSPPPARASPRGAGTPPAAASPRRPPDLGPDVSSSHPTCRPPDPGRGRRGRRPAGRQPVRHRALRAALQARHLRLGDAPAHRSRSATTPRSPASGRTPSDVTINGAVDVYNQCEPPAPDGSRLHRPQQLLALDVQPDHQRRPAATELPRGQRVLGGLAGGAHAPGRRDGPDTSFMDYCATARTTPAAASSPTPGSGGALNGSQQQFYVRNSTIGGWSNGVWNQVFSGVRRRPGAVLPGARRRLHDAGASPRCRRRSPTSTSTRRAATASSCPAAQRDSRGTTLADGHTAGRSLPLSDFFVATPRRPGREDQRRPRAGQEPAAHARRLRRRRTDPRQARRAPSCWAWAWRR